MKAPERLPMTHDERAAAAALGSVRCLPGSWEKRFATAMAERAWDPEAAITEKQRTWLWTLRHRYRRQIDPAVPNLHVPEPPKRRHAQPRLPLAL